VNAAGLYEPINLGDERFSATLAQAFFVDLQSLPVEDLLPPPDEVGPDVINNDFEIPDHAYYYNLRFPTELSERLIELGLARPKGEKVWVSPALRLLLFSVAAKYVVSLRDLESENSTPSPLASGRSVFSYTAYESAFRVGYRSPAPHQRASYLYRYEDYVPCWQVEIGSLLPCPSPGTPIEDLIRFRLRHEDERRRLVRAVGKLQYELSERNENPRDVFEELRDELREALSDLYHAAQAAKLTMVKRAVYTFIAIASGAGATTGPLHDISYVLGVLGGIAVNLATSSITGVNSDVKRYTYLQQVVHEFL
jgi:hypothetical protein